ELKQNYTIVIVTHNMQQAARASDVTAFLTMGDDRAGYLVEMDTTDKIFTRPEHRLTEDYITGRFGGEARHGERQRTGWGQCRPWPRHPATDLRAGPLEPEGQRPASRRAGRESRR